ncbi:hypothetical protein GQ42DRAFT_164287 [Ramicandelaber brevisporus]|nr:hypothetical protein GQ42DRAFT_164287 [Ramicandelaber brevisporus]
MDSEAQVTNALRTIASRAPASLQPQLHELAALYSGKLWHQLTVSTETIFLRNEEAKPFLIDLYSQFVAHWARHMNQLKRASLAAVASRQLFDAAKARDFMKEVAASIEKDASGSSGGSSSGANVASSSAGRSSGSGGAKSGPGGLAVEAQQAHILALLEAAEYQLHLGEYNAAKDVIESSAVALDGMLTVDNIVNATRYRVAAESHKNHAEFSDYYTNSLLYLAYAGDLNNLSVPGSVVATSVKDDLAARASDLIVAGLLSDTIYSFGELIQHPILNYLAGTPKEWLRNLLAAFSTGDIGKLESLAAAHFDTEQILQEHAGFLREKMCLLALVENIFQRGTAAASTPAEIAGSGGVLTFNEIAQFGKLQLIQVEHLVMKALSLGLIKGSIDQIAQSVCITWVMPRYLDITQIATVRDRITNWEGHVANTVTFVESTAEELIAQA